jgi:RNA polymerase sigma factor (sigma-70 family)
MGKMATDEAGLWSRARDGDGEAYGSLFDLHQGRVFRHTYRFIQDRHDAEDVTAAVFLELWRRRQDVRLVGGSVLPWLLVTATNSARNSRRSSRRYRQFLDSLPRGDVHQSAEDEAVADFFSAPLQAAIRRLGPVDRGLVALVILEGYPIGDAAEALGLSPGSAKTRLSRIRGRLRSELTPTDVVPHVAAKGERS